MSDTKRPGSPTEQESREVAEAAREAEWTNPSFVRELFLGRFRLDLIHPYPQQSAEDRKRTDDYIARLSKFIEENVDSDEIDRTGEIPPEVVDGLRELGAFVVLHDHRREEARPADVVAVHHLQQPLDVGALEAADVGRIVDVARRRPDQHELAEPVGLTVRRQHGDHAAHRVAHQDHLAEVQRVGRDQAWPSTVAAVKAVGLSILVELAAALLATGVWLAGTQVT